MKLSLAAILAIANAAAASASGMPNSNTIELVAADLDQAGTNPAAADPAALFVVDDARAAAAEDVSRAPKPSLRATADLQIATAPALSCVGAGDGCVAGSFCNHPVGEGGMCVTCPVKEEHCTDFGEATDACLLACFQGGADGAPVSLGVRAGFTTVVNPCPSGGCCGVQLDPFAKIITFNTYACGCGWLQTPVDRNAGDCYEKCAYRVLGQKWGPESLYYSRNCHYCDVSSFHCGEPDDNDGGSNEGGDKF